MQQRRFQYQEGKSSKFWNIGWTGNILRVDFGRIGTAGQTQIKRFATEAEAQAACEKLIREKRNKGYQEVASAGTPPDSSLRTDFSIYNEANSFFLASESLCGRDPEEVFALADSAEGMKRGLQEGLFLGCELYQDDSFTARLVLGPLTEQEETEWICRAVGKLRVPCGRLGVSGGWAVLEYHTDPENLDYYRDFLHVVSIPPGDYVVTALGYLPHAVHQYHAQYPEPIGAWFRQTRPDVALSQWPDWLAEWCGDDEDPAHRAEWDRYFGSLSPVERKRYQQAFDRYIGYLFHLQPLKEEPPLSPLDEGYLAWEIRQPERCPLGLALRK